MCSAPRRRKIYDQTGCVEDAELSGEQFDDLYSYYRAIYKKVEEADIDSFFGTYRGSAEERKDLLQLYGCVVGIRLVRARFKLGLG